MASTKFYITSGLPPNDTADDGSTKVYITSGLPPNDDGGASALLTGTAITGGVTESEIVLGGDTIISTLTGDTYVATAGDDNAITDAIIAGITSAQAEANGWNNVVKANMVYTDITRTSDTILTIILAAEATYSITANETITITIPATALTAAGAVVATPTFDVTSEGVTVNVAPGALEISGVNAAVLAEVVITATTGALSIAGLAPVVDLGVTIESTTGLVVITGQNPGISAAVTVESGLGSLSIDSKNPGVSVEIVVNSNKGAVSIVGVDPGISATTGILSGTGSVLISGFEPSISISVVLPTPKARTFYVAKENRILAVNKENRTILA